MIKIVAGDQDIYEKGRQDELDYASQMESIARRIRARVDGDPTGGYGPTLHQAFDAYIGWLKKDVQFSDLQTAMNRN